MGRSIAGVVCAIVAAAAALHAQRPQQPRYDERVDVSSIVVDVRVIDELGAPVTGLTTADFFVTVGGKPATVQSSIWTGGSPPASHADAPPPAAPATSLPEHAVPTSERRPDEPGQLVVLLFQKSLTKEHARGFIRMVEQSRDLVRTLPPQDRVAILMFDTRLTVWSDFTNDRSVLDRILEHGLLHEKPPRSVAAASPSLQEALKARKPVSTIEGAFGAIGDALQPLPGSKAIAFIGHGMGRAAFGTRRDIDEMLGKAGQARIDLVSRSETNAEYQVARRALTAARVSVFSLDITNADTHSLAAGMQAIAADTGGFYASSLDFPERPLKLFVSALNGHYVLFVEPPADPSDRVIAVAVNRRAYVYATSSYRK